MFKRAAFIWNKQFFSKIINIYTVSFDQFNVSLLNKRTDFS